MTGIAIVGQGYMGRTHADAWTRLGHGDDIRYLVAPGDREPGVAPGATFTNHLDEALLDPEVDRVCVCTPTPSHTEIAVRALRAGKHVMLEKPNALTLEDAATILEAARIAPGILMIAQVVRFFAGYEALVALRDSHRLGAIASVRATRVLARPTWAPWWPDESQSGGVPVDFAIHDYDQANVLLGEPVAVRAVQLAPEAPLEATIEYATGGLAQVLSYPYLPQGSAFCSSLELVGEHGQAGYRLLAGAPTESGASGESRLTIATVDGVESRDVADNDPYARELEYFAHCIETSTRPERSTPESAVAALRVSLAVRESIAAGRRVEL